MRALFQPGQACYHLELGGYGRPYRIAFGVIVRICRQRVTLRTLDGRELVVGGVFLAHAGYCPSCDEPAHAGAEQGGAVWSRCPRCLRPALPTPPPAGFYHARLGEPGSFWPCLIGRLALDGQMELSRGAFERLYAATPRDGLQRAA